MDAHAKSNLGESPLTQKQFSSRGAATVCGKAQKIGRVLLPPSIPGALVKWAASCKAKCRIQPELHTSNEFCLLRENSAILHTVVTSKLFSKKFTSKPPGNVIYVKTWRKSPSLQKNL